MAHRRAVPVCAERAGHQRAAPVLTSRCQDGRGRMPRQRGRAATPRASSVTWCTRLAASPRCTGPRHGGSCTTRGRTTGPRRVRSSQPELGTNDPLVRRRPPMTRGRARCHRRTRGTMTSLGGPTCLPLERGTERELDTHECASRPRPSRSSQPTKRRELGLVPRTRPFHARQGSARARSSTRAR